MPMSSKLRGYFPMIREKEQVLTEIRKKDHLQRLFDSWPLKHQEEFLDFCTGTRGVKILYDSFFKEIMNPEYAPERLNDLLSHLLKKQVKILHVLPNDSTRIADESSLLITDIVVQLEDGSLGNIEVQKIGYMFPGERSACYSADLLLRQYKRIRSELQEKFNYKKIQNVYTIILYEKSPEAFQKFPNNYLHYFHQQSDTGLKIKLLQEYLFISLDIFQKNKHNKDITNKLDAWLMFLSTDDPDSIIRLITSYPEFRPLYEEVYEICRNMEKIMGIFSEELRELDRNTVQFMIDQMQETIEKQNAELEQKNTELEQKNNLIRTLHSEKLAFIAKVRKKYLKNIPFYQCADMLEEEPERIRQIYDLISAHPEWDDGQLFEHLNTQK